MNASTLSEQSSPKATRHAPQELAPDEFRALGHDLVDRLAAFLASLPSRHVAPGEHPRQIRAALGADRPLPDEGEDAARLLDRASELVLQHSTFNGHPRFFGYITSSPAPLGALGDLLASSVNPNCGAWALSPIASEMELQSIRWIAELLGYPTTCGGILLSGGNMANIVCALAATRAAATWDVRADGIAGKPLAVYGTGETHTWLEKFTDLSGLGTRAIRRIPTDDQGRLRVDALRDAIAADRAAGVIPALVVGTAGTVMTGAIDPLVEIAAVCRQHGVWFHADGAYGAPAAALPDASADLKALSLADSIAMDPHKWMYAPLEAGCALVRDPEALRSAFSFHPPYYRFEGSEEDPPLNFFEWGPQNSRGFRALKVWLGIQHAGREGIVGSIATDIALAERLHANVASHPELDAMSLGLSISCFRYVPPALRGDTSEQTQTALDELNEKVLARLTEEGDVFLSNAVIGGRFALRACIVNFRTTAADVDAIPEIVARAGRALSESRR
jgi:aromatic-L-amino-acid decarboxylase